MKYDTKWLKIYNFKCFLTRVFFVLALSMLIFGIVFVESGKIHVGIVLILIYILIYNLTLMWCIRLKEDYKNYWKQI